MLQKNATAVAAQERLRLPSSAPQPDFTRYDEITQGMNVGGAERGGSRALSGERASIPVTLFGLVLVTFLIGRVMPIDPVIAIVGDHAPPDVVARVRAELGLDRPLAGAVLDLSEAPLLHGDLGNSVMTSHSVAADIVEFFPATLELATAAIVIAV